jgi:hypothetical protein
MTFQVVNYKNEDHILLWSGDFQLGGYGNGRNLILDRTYAVVANFTLEHGMEGSNLAEGVGADFHDAQITANDTALVRSLTLSCFLLPCLPSLPSLCLSSPPPKPSFSYPLPI